MTHYADHKDSMSKEQRKEASSSFINAAHESATNPKAIQQWQDKYAALINTHAVLELYELAQDNAMRMADKIITVATEQETTEAFNKAKESYINQFKENTTQALAKQILDGNGYEIKLPEVWADHSAGNFNGNSYQSIMMSRSIEYAEGKDHKLYAIFAYGAAELHHQADQNLHTQPEPAM